MATDSLNEQAGEALRAALDEPNGPKRLLMIERALDLHRAQRVLASAPPLAADRASD